MDNTIKLPKYNVSDKVWILQKGKNILNIFPKNSYNLYEPFIVVEGLIIETMIHIYSTDMKINYKVLHLGSIGLEEDEIFKTEEEANKYLVKKNTDYLDTKLKGLEDTLNRDKELFELQKKWTKELKKQMFKTGVKIDDSNNKVLFTGKGIVKKSNNLEG